MNHMVEAPGGQTMAQSDGGKVGVVLRLRDVSRAFRTKGGTTVPAVGPINLAVVEGEFVALVGASGCGKTTTLRLVGGLVPPTLGVIEYRGHPVTGPIEDLGIVFQHPILLDWRTVIRNVTLQSEVRGIGTPESRRESAMSLLERVGLQGLETRHPWELSGGQQQRVSLCRALIHDPGLLLMDEPFGALDAITREQLQRDLERIWIDRRSTVVFVTHDVGEAVTLADRVIVIKGKPGTVAAEIAIDVPRPRGGRLMEDERLQAYAREVRRALSD